MVRQCFRLLSTTLINGFYTLSLRIYKISSIFTNVTILLVQLHNYYIRDINYQRHIRTQFTIDRSDHIPINTHQNNGFLYGPMFCIIMVLVERFVLFLYVYDIIGLQYIQVLLTRAQFADKASHIQFGSIVAYSWNT